MVAAVAASTAFAASTAVTVTVTDQLGASTVVGVVKRWQDGFATVVVIAVTVILAVLDLTDEASRRWSADHAFTTSTVASLLVLAITVLVVNQVLRIRQDKDRAQATAAQAAIVLAQAARARKAVSGAADGSDQRQAASEEVRAYLTMLLIAAPILIDSPVPRAFLERAQQLAAVLARTLAAVDKTPAAPAQSADSLGDAFGRLRTAATPLLQVLTPAQRTATGADDVAESGQPSADIPPISG